MGDFSNLREDGSINEPTFDEVSIVTGDRTEQPGTLYRDPRSWPQRIQHEQRQEWIPTQQRPSDKFGIINLLVDQTRPYQIVPANYSRKSAFIMCMANPIYLGTLEAVSSCLGVVYAATPGGLPPNVFVLPASVLTGATPLMFGLEFDCKQGLYCASAAAAQAQVQALVDTFDSGTPIT
jgi:hypothetical protein